MKELRGVTGSTKRKVGAKKRESLNIGNFLPFTQLLTVFIKVLYNIGIKGAIRQPFGSVM